MISPPGRESSWLQRGLFRSRCGQMDGLNPDGLSIETEAFWKTFLGRIDKVEVRADGVCKNYLKRHPI